MILPFFPPIWSFFDSPFQYTFIDFRSPIGLKIFFVGSNKKKVCFDNFFTRSMVATSYESCCLSSATGHTFAVKSKLTCRQAPRDNFVWRIADTLHQRQLRLKNYWYHAGSSRHALQPSKGYGHSSHLKMHWLNFAINTLYSWCLSVVQLYGKRLMKCQMSNLRIKYNGSIMGKFNGVYKIY